MSEIVDDALNRKWANMGHVVVSRRFVNTFGWDPSFRFARNTQETHLARRPHSDGQVRPLSHDMRGGAWGRGDVAPSPGLAARETAGEVGGDTTFGASRHSRELVGIALGGRR